MDPVWNDTGSTALTSFSSSTLGTKFVVSSVSLLFSLDPQLSVTPFSVSFPPGAEMGEKIDIRVKEFYRAKGNMSDEMIVDFINEKVGMFPTRAHKVSLG